MPAPSRLLIGSFAVLLLAPHAARAQEDPRAVVRTATHAVEGDSAPAVARAWERRSQRDSSDAAALLGLATIMRLTYRLPEASRLYDRLTTPARRADGFTVHAWLGHAALLDDQGDKRSRAMFERARSLAHELGDRTGEGIALMESAFASVGNSGATAALARFDTAARLIDRAAVDQHARLLRLRALLLVVRGDPDGARVAFAARDLARASGVPREAAAAVRTLGIHAELLGRGDSALARYDEAARLFRSSRDRRSVAFTLLHRAEYLLGVAEFGEAKTAIRQALMEAEASRYALGVANSRLGLAIIAFRLGDYSDALEHIGIALPRLDSLGDRSSSTLAHLLRAQVLLAAGEMEDARREMPWMLEVARQHPEMEERIEAHHVLAALALGGGDAGDAARRVEDGLRLARGPTGRTWRARLLVARARVAVARGRLGAAHTAAAEALRASDSTQRVVRYDARVLLADIAGRGGDVAGAERELAGAAAELDAWRAGLSDRALRTLVFQASMSGTHDQDASVARALHAIATRGDPARAFALAEGRRARELADRMVRRALLSDVVSDRQPRVVLQASAPTKVGDIAASLPPATALLEFVVAPGDAPTTLLVVTAAGVTARTLPPVDSIRGDIARLAALVEAGEDARAIARRLGTTLLEPTLNLLPAGTTRLVIVPDGVLHRVPFDALRIGDGRLVVERFTVALAPSAGVAAALWRHAPRSGRVARLLSFGDPIFPGEATTANAANAAVQRSGFIATGGLPRLEESAREARLVARYAPSAQVRLRGEASALYLKRAPLDSFSVIHLATHALVDERAASRTSLALAPGEGESGFVSPADLAALRLDADLVVLSACRTASGVIVGGEGVQGLTGPLLEAGARAVVATSWRIGDRATVPFVRAFYDALAAGQAAGDALRTAKLDAIRRGAPASEWAAFQLIGNPLVRVALRPPPPALWPWATGAGMLLLAVAGYSLTRRRRAPDRLSLPSPA